MIKFRMLSKHDLESARLIAQDLRSRGFEVTDVGEADILRDEDNVKEDEVYVIHAQGSAWDYLKFRNLVTSEKYGLREFRYEGVRTLG